MTRQQPGQSKVALITGGAQGIGLATATRLQGAGYAVALIDIARDRLEAAVARLASAGEVLAIAADVSDPAAVDASMRQVEAHFGRLDVLVNSAGMLGLVDKKPPAVDAMPLAVWDKVIAVNLTGPFLMCRAAIPLMRRSGGGRIVNVASRAARVRSGDPAYAASKGGLLSLSRYIAGEVAPHGITVNCIAPSRVETEMTRFNAAPEVTARKVSETPLGRLGTVDDMAGAIVFLVSPDASFMTGAVLDVNGGSFMQ
jgi:NAD(P)-dependent dehydrogenase (short-subunit alcohol dehydrogenase family)